MIERKNFLFQFIFKNSLKFNHFSNKIIKQNMVHQMTLIIIKKLLPEKVKRKEFLFLIKCKMNINVKCGFFFNSQENLIDLIFFFYFLCLSSDKEDIFTLKSDGKFFFLVKQ